MCTTAFTFSGGLWGPPIVGNQEGEGLYRIYSPPCRLSWQRQTYSAEAEDLGAQGGEWVGLDPPQSYEAALWATNQKALETTKALQEDLERLDNECRERSQVCSQNRSQPRTRSGS